MLEVTFARALDSRWPAKRELVATDAPREGIVAAMPISLARHSVNSTKAGRVLACEFLILEKAGTAVLSNGRPKCLQVHLWNDK